MLSHAHMNGGSHENRLDQLACMGNPGRADSHILAVDCGDGAVICYLDKTFCTSLSCRNDECHRKITNEQRKKAIDMNLPVAYADFQTGCPFCIGKEE